jgi:hypothetical protein
MSNLYSYEGILSAVGRVLDNAGVKRIGVRDTGDSLIVEGFDSAGLPQVSLRYDVADLFDLLHALADTPHPKARPGGTLRHFLDQHELVGVRQGAEGF